MRRSLPLLALLLAAGPLAAQEGRPPGLPPGVVLDPAEARLSTDDLDRFAGLHAELGAAADPAALVDSLYLRPATPGLQAYARIYGVDAAGLAETVARETALYGRVAREAPAAVRGLEPRIRQAFARLAELHPAAVFPPVWYLVGPARAGGAVQPEGVLIAVEVYTPRTGEPVDSLDNDLDDLVHLVAHELVHYQQAAADLEAYMREPTLLGRAIREGVADFVAERISGDHTNRRGHAWAEGREREFWAEFRCEMGEPATGDWFFTRPGREGWPRDLGYVVGYRIAAAYADQHPETAVPDLIRRTTDPAALLEASGYEDSLGDAFPACGD